MNNEQFALAIKGTRFSEKTITIARRVFVGNEDRAHVVATAAISKQRLSHILKTAEKNYMKQLSKYNMHHIDVVVTAEMKEKLEKLEKETLNEITKI
ncbi:MAG: hypothetical protein GY820_35500 [Gammaproteobacteria bacterium]|nr:hypothetical protein [Gammaproteobacteria bacterium]